jgi:hypothetical protein
MKMISKKLGLRLAALTAATVGLSGCVYDVGLGYASDGYGYNDYDCDPYSQFDSYYACDNSYGFYNIGFGGGWYNSFWYPGHGYYVFDNYGRRFNMRDDHRRYWGDQRQRWYRNNRGHDNGRGYDGRGRDDRGHDGRGYDRRGYDGRGHGRGHNSTDRGVDQPIGWPENHGGRRDERPGRPNSGNPGPEVGGNGNYDGRRGDREDRRGGRGEGRRGRDIGQATGDAVAQPIPQPMARPGPDGRAERPGRGDGDGEGGGRRDGGRYDGGGRVPQQSNDAPQGAMPQSAGAPPPPRQRDEPPPSRPRNDQPRRQDLPESLPE